ncbi:hypothetical protein CYMTET_35941, partial [Cymbomonas tetramitiformis]
REGEWKETVVSEKGDCARGIGDGNLLVMSHERSWLNSDDALMGPFDKFVKWRHNIYQTPPWRGASPSTRVMSRTCDEMEGHRREQSGMVVIVMVGRGGGGKEVMVVEGREGKEEAAGKEEGGGEGGKEGWRWWRAKRWQSGSEAERDGSVGEWEREEEESA